jgi:hypothetical protein
MVNADELTLTFTTFATIAHQLRAQYPISDETLASLKAVDDVLKEISGRENTRLWS